MSKFTILYSLLIASLTKGNHVTQEISEIKDYHIRRIYYNQRENVCHGDQDLSRRDILKVKIQLPNKLIEDTAITFTSCGNQPLISWNSMTILPKFTLTWNYRGNSQHDEIGFAQEMQRISVGPVGLSATVKTTVEYAIISREQYDCQIQGDDTIDHFGYYNDISPPTIKVSCNKSLNLIKE